MTGYLLLGLLGLFIAAYYFGALRATVLSQGIPSSLHSRPSYHGAYLAILACLPSLIVVFIWAVAADRVLDSIIVRRFSDAVSMLNLPETEAFLRDARALAFGGIVGSVDAVKTEAGEMFSSLQWTSNFLLLVLLAVLILGGIFYGYKNISPSKRTRHFVERTIMGLLIACSVVAILTTIGIVVSLIFESFRFFQEVPLLKFLFGTHWSPQSAFQGAGAEQTTNPEVFGAIPLLAGTLLITFIAICVAAPVGLFSAIYLADYAAPKFRATAKPILEILAGIPTVVYGFFAALTVAPFLRRYGEGVGLTVSSESALAAGLVMGIMIIPFVSSLSDDVISAVPQSLRDGSAGLGATKSETIRKVVLPAALPGIVSALILAISRAIGETMIVVMAAGLAANLTINPLEAVTTVTVQIVTLLVGDQEFDSAKTLAAFALGLMLFCITLALNIFALRVVRKYREQYD